MKLKIQDALLKGIKAHKAGKIKEADQYFTSILKSQPKHPDANHNMGILAVGINKIEEALPFFKTAVETKPNSEQFWLSYISTLISIGRLKEAKINLIKAKSIFKDKKIFDELEKKMIKNEIDPPENVLISILETFKKKQFEETFTLLGRVNEEYPNSSKLSNFEGLIFYKLNKIEKSIISYKKAIELNEENFEAYNNLGNSYKKYGDLKRAIKNYNISVLKNPKFAEPHYNIGNIYYTKQDLYEAIDSYNRALRIKPTHVKSLNNLGNIYLKIGKIKEAIKNYKTALNLVPNSADLNINLGKALKIKGDIKGAIDIFYKVTVIEPENSLAFYNIGIIYQEIEQYDRALINYKKAFNFDNKNVESLKNIGIIYRFKGDHKSALKIFEKVISIRPNHVFAHYQISLIKKYISRDKQFLMMLEILKENKITRTEYCYLYFSLGKAFADLEEYENSFKYYVYGNNIRKNMLNYKIENDKEFFLLLKNSFKSINEINLEIKKNELNLKIIFIVGMPRSGTSLVEQIISSHSQVTGAGELDYINSFGRELAKGCNLSSLNLSEFRKKYLLEMHKRANGNLFVTDKMPSNFMYISLIQKTFPEAKIVHVKRNPAATCWSNYKTLFSSNSLGFTYDINNLVEYYKIYKELMNFWNLNLSEFIYELNYEGLTEDQEFETRKLMDFLELPWEESCLKPEDNNRPVRTASSIIVKNKIYTKSSLKWKKYEAFLNGKLDDLLSS